MICLNFILCALICLFIIYENLVSCGILSFVTLNQLIKFHCFFTIAAYCNKYNVECIVSVTNRDKWRYFCIHAST